MKYSRCPVCKTRLTLRQLYFYSTLYGVRRVKPCPRCGAMLRWTKQPFIFMNLGSAVLIAAAGSVFILSERLFHAWNTPTMLFFLGAVTVLISLSLMHLELVYDDQI